MSAQRIHAERGAAEPTVIETPRPTRFTRQNPPTLDDLPPAAPIAMAALYLGCGETSLREDVRTGKVPTVPRSGVQCIPRAVLARMNGESIEPPAQVGNAVWLRLARTALEGLVSTGQMMLDVINETNEPDREETP